MSEESRYPDEYQSYMHPVFGMLGGGFFVCWWLFLAYMVTTSYKDGPVAYVVSYGFLAVGLLAVVYVLSSIIRAKITVKGTIITRTFAFRAPKTYDINEVTKVVIHRARGTISYRVYIGKEKIFTLSSIMVNQDRLIATLQRDHVPVSSSIF